VQAQLSQAANGDFKGQVHGLNLARLHVFSKQRWLS
jgi:hypothetical protein